METYDRNKAKKISRETISEDVANYKKSTIEESLKTLGKNASR